MSSGERLHVAVAVVCDKDRQYLLSQRHSHVHQGGLWEFPGGKVEAGETVEQALIRELYEELHIVPISMRPLIKIPYDYPDKKVFLDVWLITSYTGNPVGAEGQPVDWVSKEDLCAKEMPAANYAIVNACSLPDRYLITPEPGSSGRERRDFLNSLEKSLKNGIRLLQFRAKSLDHDQYVELAESVISICHDAGCKVLLNTTQDCEVLSLANGLHLSSTLLIEMNERNIPDGLLLSASCHNIEELQHANMIGCDFVVLGPVNRTTSHPNTLPVGWKAFEQMCEESRVPVYALGGMTTAHVDTAWKHGAQGISGISALWINA